MGVERVGRKVGLWTDTVGGVVSGLLDWPFILRLEHSQSVIPSTFGNPGASYMTIAFKILMPAISRQLSQGLVKPLPSLRWCLLSLASSGTAPIIEDDDIVATYRAAAVAELDILFELRRGLSRP